MSNFLINHIDLISSLVHRAMRCQTKSVFVTLIRSSSVCQALFPLDSVSPSCSFYFLSIGSISHFWVLPFSTLWLKLILLNPYCVCFCARFFFVFFPHECVATSQYLWQQIVLPPKSTCNNTTDSFSIATLPVISRCTVKFRQCTKYTEQLECFNVFPPFVFLGIFVDVTMTKWSKKMFNTYFCKFPCW